MNNFKKISAVILVLCTSVAIFTSCTNDKSKLTDDKSSTSVTEEAVTEIITNEEGETSVIEVTDNITDIKSDTGKKDETITIKEKVTVEVTDKKGDVSVSVSEKTVIIPAKTTVRTVLTTVKQQTVSAIINTTVPAVKTTKTNTTKPTVKTTAKPTVKPTIQTTKKAVVDDTIIEKSVGISMLTKTDPVQIGNQASIFIQGTPGKTYSIEFYETPSSTANLTSLEDKKADANGFVSWTFEIRNTCNLGKRKLIIKEKNTSNYLETSITVK